MKILVAFVLLTIFLWVFCRPLFSALGYFFKKLLNIEGDKE